MAPPVVDSLGAASPHGRYWPAFFAAFFVMLVAIRVFICWVYDRTGSVRLAQLLHACSTGSLVLLSPTHVSAGQESLWYLSYAALLWTGIAAAIVAARLPLARLPGHPTAQVQSQLSWH
jgi:hypothetical protein